MIVCLGVIVNVARNGNGCVCVCVQVQFPPECDITLYHVQKQHRVQAPFFMVSLELFALWMHWIQILIQVLGICLIMRSFTHKNALIPASNTR